MAPDSTSGAADRRIVMRFTRSALVPGLLLALVWSGLAVSGAMQTPPRSSAGALANSCGVPAAPPASGRGAPPVFPAGEYPVSLPPVSHLGARNDLPTPYAPGVDFGQLPAGRTWGSTASVTTAPDGTI